MEEAKKGKRNEEIMKKILKASFNPCAYTPSHGLVHTHTPNMEPKFDAGTSIMGDVPRLTLKQLGGASIAMENQPTRYPELNVQEAAVFIPHHSISDFLLTNYFCKELKPTDKAMIDASSSRPLMNKTAEEAWELIEIVADANQHFKTRATTKGVYEVAPSESTVLAKSLVDIASMLKEIKEGQQPTPILLKHQTNSSQQTPARHCESILAILTTLMNVHSCRKTTPWHPLRISLTPHHCHLTIRNITPKGGMIIIQLDGSPPQQQQQN
ncbi:hypothetical protein PIB30_060830 [Stylosanthes scabra]|uniref:Uncharacterized protein n=1 Tax=Stylosanthes scabra TaxID=79078 RepID=A0ABU6SMG9_9FABA|nr:hypothetical protein [Stylosanthes scabra]